MQILLIAVAILRDCCLAATSPLEPGKPVDPFAGKTRHYALTAKSDYAAGNFQAEVTVTVHGGGGNGCAFFGLGKGEASPAAYDEPTTTPSLAFRMAPSDFCGGPLAAYLNADATGAEERLGDGTHRLRFSWDAAKRRAWLEIHPHWKQGAAFWPTISLFVARVPVEFGDDAHLFVGGAAGVSFADFVVKPVAAAELAMLPASDNFSKDPSAGTWLRVDGVTTLPADASTAAADLFLKDMNAHLRPIVCWYQNASLQASRTLPGGQLRLPGSKWDVAVKVQPVAGDPAAHDFTLLFRLKEGTARSGGVAAAFDFDDWSTNNYVLIPASVYNGNRNRIVARGYAQGLDPQDYYRKDLPLTHGSVPCLAQETGKPSKLEVNASNAATPAVCIFDRKAKRGFILLAEQAGRRVPCLHGRGRSLANGDFLRKSNGEIFDNAFAVEESADRSRATVVVSAPGVREKKPEFIGFSASPDRGITMKAGEAVQLRLRVYSFAAADIPALFEKFMSVRKSLTGPNHPRNLLPESEHRRRLIAFTNGRFLSTPRAKFYMPENGNWIAFGWIGGWINTFPMLAQGDVERLARVGQTFDFGIKAQEPSGYFHYAIRQDGNTSFREPKPDMNLARTSGDILFWMIKQFDLLKAQGRGDSSALAVQARNPAVKPAWEASMGKLADGLVSTWKKERPVGQDDQRQDGRSFRIQFLRRRHVHRRTGTCRRLLQESRVPRHREAGGRFLLPARIREQGQVTGACADILQNADSETAAGFTTALMALYDVTGDRVWLEKSRNLANLAATWTVSYDYELPKFTALGALGTKLAGAVWASTQNKHAAPGICCSSGDPFFKIYRATGDTRYAELMRDILHAHADAIAGGGGSERLTYCDADSRGDNPGGCNGWVATDGALMTLEIPGIYLRTDTDRFYVFDSVECKVVKRDAAGVTLSIKNPTKFDAKVTIFAETGAQAAKPLGTTAFLKWPRVNVKPGETVRIGVSKDGSVATAP